MTRHDIPFWPRSELGSANDALLRELLREMEATREELARAAKAKNGNGNGNGKNRYGWALGILGSLIVAALIAAYGFLWSADNRVGRNEGAVAALGTQCVDHEMRIRELERVHRTGGGNED